MRFKYFLKILLINFSVISCSQAVEESPFSNVVEFRVYQMRSGMTEKFMDYFEEHFLESQEQAGMKIWGQFFNLKNPDQFVWIRGFKDMVDRKDALEAFYSGPVWEDYAAEARALMINSSNVRLLNPYNETTVLPAKASRPLYAYTQKGYSDARQSGFIVAEIYYLNPSSVEAFSQSFATTILPELKKDGVTSLGLFNAELSENTFPRLPVQQDPQQIVWLSRYDSEENYQTTHSKLINSENWKSLTDFVQKSSSGVPKTKSFFLKPGKRSRLN